MNNNSITAKITGVAGNTATATLKVSTDFRSIVHVAISSANPENVTRNLIFKVFQESDIKEVYTYSTVPLELTLASGADRTPTDIKQS